MCCRLQVLFNTPRDDPRPCRLLTNEEFCSKDGITMPDHEVYYFWRILELLCFTITNVN